MTSKPMVFCLGANHRSADIALRERLYLSADELRLALKPLQHELRFSELMALSTCNRLEVFGVVEHQDLPEQAIYECFLKLQQIAGHQSQTIEGLRKFCYLHVGYDAIQHMLQVAASLDSLVVGETQITGQFKDALSLATEVEAMGPILTRLGQGALATAKKVRTSTEIGKRSVSIGSAAVELASMMLGDLGERVVLVVGAGDMARISCQHLLKQQPQRLLIANRSLERAAQLIQELGYGTSVAFAGLNAALLQADLVITATAAPGALIDAKTLHGMMMQRRDHPLYMIDISLPRNIDVACSELDDVYLFGIDDLNQVIDENMNSRQAAVAEAQKIIETDSAVLERWLGTLQNKPALLEFRDYLNQILQGEFARTRKKMHAAPMSAPQELALEKMLQAISKKICGDVANVLRSPPDGMYADQLAAALCAFFVPTLTGDKRTANGEDAGD